jgi:hypothetical protein
LALQRAIHGLVKHRKDIGGELGRNSEPASIISLTMASYTFAASWRFPTTISKLQLNRIANHIANRGRLGTSVCSIFERL